MLAREQLSTTTGLGVVTRQIFCTSPSERLISQLGAVKLASRQASQEGVEMRKQVEESVAAEGARRATGATVGVCFRPGVSARRCCVCSPAPRRSEILTLDLDRFMGGRSPSNADTPPTPSRH